MTERESAHPKDQLLPTRSGGDGQDQERDHDQDHDQENQDQDQEDHRTARKTSDASRENNNDNVSQVSLNFSFFPRLCLRVLSKILVWC